MKASLRKLPTRKPTSKSIPVITVDKRIPILEHLKELRSRAIHVALSVFLFASAAYFVQQHLVNILIKPAHGEHFIYTSPVGGINFLFGLCLDVGLIFSFPILAYELLGFLAPLMKPSLRRFISRSVFISVGLGAGGILFGYFFGLPLALHFLGHQFTTKQITPLLTISEYLSFVTLYLGGAALLFQIPLIIAIINRIKPIKPRTLLKLERWVIVFAFVVAIIMAPTVNLLDQLVIAGPVIIAYQIGILLVWYSQKKREAMKSVLIPSRPTRPSRRSPGNTGPGRDFAHFHQPKETLKKPT
jgi:sec-independent protein translocase protein TatC